MLTKSFARILMIVIGLFVLSLVLSACSALTIASAGQQNADARPVQVDSVSVEVGVGSPIPVEVIVSGSWPDLCAQLSQITQVIDGSNIEITLLATPADPDCPPDYLGLPFRIAIPLNIAEMSLDTYRITINGVQATFDWAGQDSTITKI
jgi:hypothetical protein